MYRLILLFICFSLFSIKSYSQACITINEQPQDQLFLDNDNIILSVGATSSENLSYQWQLFNDTSGEWENINNGFDYAGTNTPTLTLINVSQAISGTIFRVQISGQDPLCTQDSNQAVVRFININVNNIFTPNDDGFNDFFNIGGILSFPNSKLQIYNRWGNLVYEKIGYQNDWNGIATTGVTINGSKRLPTGTYFYTIDLNFDNKKFSGWLYLTR